MFVFIFMKTIVSHPNIFRAPQIWPGLMSYPQTEWDNILYQEWFYVYPETKAEMSTDTCDT